MSFLKLFVDHTKQDSFVNRLRKKRFALLEKKIESLAALKGSVKILDIGGDISYWKHIGWHDQRAQIYLLNLYENNIEEKDSHIFHSVKGDALNLPFSYGEFDLVFSNSVIEHVGSTENQQKFAAEVTRISDKYIIQTPSFWFPLEPHSLIPFFQFIPHKIRALFIMRFNINYFPKTKDYRQAVAVSRSTLMFTKKDFQKLFPDAEIHVERLLGIPKSYTAVKM
jgi:2-polyprenyl-3-methyl-5-hydroxy-6-metoxy-1,4-benzoquinol methylase